MDILNRELAQELTKRIFKLSDLDQTEVIISSRLIELTRFAANAITQNVSNSDQSLCIRLVSGKREAKADTNQFDDASLKRTIQAAKELLQFAKDDPELQPLVKEQTQYRQQEGAHFSTTIDTTPAKRAQTVADACKNCQQQELEGSGIFATGADATVYANSNGLFGYHCSTGAVFSLTAITDGGVSEGWAMSTDPDATKLDSKKVINVAIENAKHGVNPIALSPEHYTVILEPAAVAELLLFFSWMGFGSLQYQEGRSYAVERIGKKVFSNKLSIHDDTYHSAILGTPFDFEGVARQAVTLIDQGVVRNLIWDRKTAAAEKNKQCSTGHSLPQPNSMGPQADALVVDGENLSKEDLIKSTQKGLLVSKLHYCNIVDPMELSITGMTRSGLFLIENGKITKPVKNFRFTVSLLDIFSEENLENLGRPERTGGAFFSACSSFVPPMKIRKFNMTSGTDF